MLTGVDAPLSGGAADAVGVEGPEEEGAVDGPWPGLTRRDRMLRSDIWSR